jgi:hypothetical protein
MFRKGTLQLQWQSLMIDFVLGVGGFVLVIVSVMLLTLFARLRSGTLIAKFFLAGLLVIGGALGAILYPESRH